MSFRNFGFTFMLVALTVACGDEKKDGTAGQAKLAMSKGTSLMLNTAPTLYTPTKLAIKIQSAYIVNDVDANQGNVGIANYIWSSPDCPLKDQETEQGDKKFIYKMSDGECADNPNSSFLELARDSAAVNADLNSQNLPVLPGTYNYVRMMVCIGSSSSPTIKFQAPGMTSVQAVAEGTCGITSAKAATPVTIGEGEAVTISVAYDLTGLVYDYGAGMSKGDNCWFSTDGTIRRCVGFPNLVLSASKQ